MNCVKIKHFQKDQIDKFSGHVNKLKQKKIHTHNLRWKYPQSFDREV